MADFKVGLRVDVTGSRNLDALEREINNLGIAFNRTSDVVDKSVTVNGQRVEAYSVTIRTMNAAHKAHIRNAMAGITANARFGASIDETESSIDQISKMFDKEARSAANATAAVNRQAQAMANLAQRQALMTTAHSDRLMNTLASRDLNRDADGNEFDRRRNARQLDDDARYQRQQEVMNQRHQLAMQRISAYGGGSSAGPFAQGVVNGGIVKVLAYDALRRTLTNVYQTVGQIGHELTGWVVESIKFNDEMKRAETVFTGLGLLGLKNKDGSSMAISDAEKSTNPKVQKALEESQVFSKDMMNKALSASILTGQDANELVSSARQLITDLLNKKSNNMKPGENALLQNPQELAKVTEGMIKLGAALKMADPGGRKLSFHMVAVQELFSGSSGGKKDTGLANVRSMMMREGIKIREVDALPIAQAVNKGELNKAAELIKIVMEKAGMSDVTSKNLQEKTLLPNIDGVITASKSITAAFTDHLYGNLVENFKKWRIALAGVLDNKKTMATIERAGKAFSKVFDYVTNAVSDALGKMIDNPEKVASALNMVSANMAPMVRISTDLAIGLGKFIAGMMGLNDGKTLDFSSIEKFAKQINEMGLEAGNKTRDVFDQILQELAPITENIVPIFVAIGATTVFIFDNVSKAIGYVTIVTQKFVTWAASVMNYMTGGLAGKFLDLNILGTKDAWGAINDGTNSVIDHTAQAEELRALFGTYSMDKGWEGPDLEIIRMAMKDQGNGLSDKKLDNVFTRAAAISAGMSNKKTEQQKADNARLRADVARSAAAQARLEQGGLVGLMQARQTAEVRVPKIPVIPAMAKQPAIPGVFKQQIQNAPVPPSKVPAFPKITPADAGLTSKPIIVPTKSIIDAMKASPLIVKPSQIRQDTNISIGTMTVNADNAQDIINHFVNLSKVKPKKKMNGPWSPDEMTKQGW